MDKQAQAERTNCHFKPIPTEFKGIVYRSKLEAHWAVYFDTLGVDFVYEAQGFQLKSGWYLPDFKFPDYGAYGEVKPRNEIDDFDLLRMIEFGEKEELILFYGTPNANSTRVYAPWNPEGNLSYVPFADQVKKSYGLLFDQGENFNNIGFSYLQPYAYAIKFATNFRFDRRFSVTNLQP